MKIVYMGTPDFAVAGLEALLKSEHQVVGVVTAPDKPAGRGRKMRPSAVKLAAQKQGIPLMQPTNLKDPEFIEELKSFQAGLFVVVAFRMLPRVVWELPPRGTVNLHASLLPQYRGAAPINWAIINGERETGVTTFFINENIDTGAMIYQKKVAIADDDTAGSLHDKLRTVGAGLLADTVKAIASNTAPRKLQPEMGQLKKAPKIFKEHQKIDFNRPVQDVYNHIRGLAPYPAGYSYLQNDQNQYMLKFFKVNYREENTGLKPGKIRSDGRSFVKIACENGFIELQEVQIAGKKRMKIKELLNGFTFHQNAQMA